MIRHGPIIKRQPLADNPAFNARRVLSIEGKTPNYSGCHSARDATEILRVITLRPESANSGASHAPCSLLVSGHSLIVSPNIPFSRRRPPGTVIHNARQAVGCEVKSTSQSSPSMAGYLRHRIVFEIVGDVNFCYGIVE